MNNYQTNRDYHNNDNKSRESVTKRGSIRRKLNSIRQTIKKLVYKIKRVLTVLITFYLFTSLLLIFFMGDHIIYAVTHNSEIEVLKSIDSVVRKEMLESATRLEKRLEEEKKKEIELQFNKVTKEKDKKIENPFKIQTIEAAEIPGIEVVKKITAYSSEKRQTDATPCLAEPSGLDICKLYNEKKYEEKGVRICASNDYQLGTVLEVQYLKGGRCIVLDRAGSNNMVDIYMGDATQTSRAFTFGKQYLKVKPVGFVPRENWDNLMSL